MKFYFKMIDGKKYYCFADGTMHQKDGSNVEVPETDTETPELEAGTDDAAEAVAKFMEAGMSKAQAENKAAFDASMKEAQGAMTDFFKSVAETAKANVTVKAEAGEEDETVEEAKKTLAALGNKSLRTATLSFKSVRQLASLTKSTGEANLTDPKDILDPLKDPNVEREATHIPFIEDIATVVPMGDSDFLSYVEASLRSGTGAPATTGELDAANERDFDFTAKQAFLKEISVSNKATRWLLQDLPQFVSQINEWLKTDVNIEVNNQLLSGDGTGNNLTGVLAVASELDAAAVGTTRVAQANIYDVLRLAITKMAVDGKQKYFPTRIALHPTDAFELDTTKDDNGQYVLPPFKSADGTVIKNVRVMESTTIPVGEFLLGDFTKLKVGKKGDIQVHFTDSDASDFKKGIITVLVTRRVAAYVKVNDSAAFVTGNIADIKAALLAPAA